MAKRLTKAQQAEEREKQVRAALAWPDYPCPEPQTDEYMKAATAHLNNGETARAWTYNAYSRRVTQGCYSRVSHSTEGARTSTQTQGGPWFDTEADAYRAMRWAVTRRMAIELAEIDAVTANEKPAAA